MTMPSNSLADVRLMQLVSSALPIGAFTYSQGLEWAIETNWLNDSASIEDWLLGQMEDTLVYLDIPVYKRLFQAIGSNDKQSAEYWSAFLLACRETKELRQEELNRGRALTRLLIDLPVKDAKDWQSILEQCQSAGFAFASNDWSISLEKSALGFAWGWLENQIAAAIKLVPLGQTAGQQLLLSLSTRLNDIVTRGLVIDDDGIGANSPALAMASSFHETQYTRLFRS